MYRSFTADDYRKHIGMPAEYSVEGFIIYGTFRSYPYEKLKESLDRLGYEATFSRAEHEFLQPVQEFQIKGKNYWFVAAYGGALLSEYLHLASMWGSKKNILIGSCGGLLKQAKSLEIIVPTWSFAEESSAKAYQPEANNKYEADEILSGRLAKKLSEKYKTYRGPTVTYQAMLGETWEDVQRWSEEGYAGVEMEAATVFATSKHFNVPAAAILRIGDNLIEQETVLDLNYEQGQDIRRKVSDDIFDIVIEETIEQ